MFAQKIAYAIALVSVLAMSTTTTRGATLAARANSGDGTFYSTGLGACGVTNTDTDLIAAMAHATFDSFPGATGNPNTNPICNKQVRATYQGKSVTVKITDRCAGCAGQFDLDFSPSAFSKIADQSAGRIHGVQWEYV